LDDVISVCVLVCVMTSSQAAAALRAATTCK